MNSIINSDRGVRRIMTEHRGWGRDRLHDVQISCGPGAWSFFYGLYYAGRKSSGDGAYVSPPVDAYGRARDKAFTEAELDLIADKVAAASKEVGLPHKVEFRNQADHDQVTRVIGPRGEWIRKR